MYNNKIALESFLQRGKSDLFVNLTSLCENAIDLVRSLESEDLKHITDVVSRSSFRKDLKNILTSHLGTTFSFVKLFGSKNINMGMMYFNRLKQASKFDKKSTANMSVANVRKYFDDKTFTINQKDFSSQYIGFGIFLNVAFFSIKNADGSYMFTAEEVASGLLHELGHIDYLLRTEYKCKKILQDSSDIVTLVSQSPDLETIQEVLNKLNQSSRITDDWKPVLKTVTEYFGSKPNEIDPVYIEAINSLILLTSFDVSIKLNKYITDEFLQITNRIQSDVFTVDEERSADEFSSRNGAYAALTSFLAKADNYHYSLKNPKYTFNKSFIVESIIHSMTYFANIFSISLDEINPNYDPTLRRMMLVVETAKHAFHDPDLDEETKTYIKDQIMEAEVYIKSFKDQKHLKIRRELNQWKKNIAAVGRVIVLPFRSRLLSDYNRLQEANRSLSRHSLYYVAEK